MKKAIIVCASMFICLFGRFPAYSQVTIIQQDYDALVAIYNSTNGTSWYTSTNWLTAVDEGTWYGVTVTGDRVTSLDLSWNNLVGSIPPEIGDLTALTSLTIQDANFTGTSIPAEIGNLTSLTSLNLYYNKLTGSIPAEIGNLTNLNYLYLYYNQLTGSIPSEIGNLTNLYYLFLSYNQLSGSIPASLGGMTNLFYLLLSYNQLSGPIPPELGDFPNMYYLFLDNNALSGSIPPELGNLTSLYYLFLNNNKLSGSIPSELGNLSQVDYFYLFDNQITGAVPSSLVNLPASVYIYLYNNQISELPDISLFNFAYFDISNNNLTFEDLELNYSHANFNYSPQHVIPSDGKIFLNQGDPYNATFDVGGTNGIFQWYKDDSPYGNTNTLDIPSFTSADNGTYDLSITNSVVTGLTLEIEPIIIAENIPGTACELAVDAMTGINNTPSAPYWFEYTIAEDAPINITIANLSNTAELKIYDVCDGSQIGNTYTFSGDLSQISLDIPIGETILLLWDDTYSSNGFSWNLAIDQAEDYFWVGNSGNWNDLSHWATQSGGNIFHTTLPGQTDNIFFDQNSFSSTNQTVNGDMDISINNLDWSNVTNSPYFYSYSYFNVYGDIVIGDNMSKYFSYINIVGNETRDISIAGTGIYQIAFSGEGTYNLVSDLTASFFWIYSGTLNARNINMNAQVYFYMDQQNSDLLTLDFENSNITALYWLSYFFSGDATVINPPAMIFVKYYFYDFLFNNEGIEFPGITAGPGEIRFYTNDNAQVFTILPGTTFYMGAGNTLSAGEFQIDGTQNQPITVLSTSYGSRGYFNQTSGTVDAKWMYIYDNEAQGGATFNASYSYDYGNVAGWNFVCPDNVILTAEVTGEETCEGAGDAVVALSLQNGEGTYNYTYDGFNYQSNNIFDNLNPGDYTFTAQDQFSCEFDAALLTINPKIDPVWYRDLDEDGFGSTIATLSACSQPEGYVTNSTDCNDSDPEINPERIWYRDADNDGFGNPDDPTQGCEQPDGFVSDAGDCDDNDATVMPSLWFRDSDGDGYGDPDVTEYSCTQPTSFVNNSTDCNDRNEDIHPGTTWYPDADGDGYGISSNSIVACDPPAGYALVDGDCNDSDQMSNPETVWYADADNDGFGNIEVTTQACAKPAGFVADNTDCDDTDDAANPDQVWYADADRDGYGDASVSKTSCIRVFAYVTNSSDCDDSDDKVYPGAPASPDGKDNDCDGNIEKNAQSINFDAIDDQVDVGIVITLDAWATSGLPVNYSVDGPAILEPFSLNLTGAGSVTLTLTQPGNSDYSAATPVVATFCVFPIPVISLDGTSTTGITLTSNYETGNQWFKDGVAVSGATGESFEPTESGTYHLEVTIDGCTGVSDEMDIIILGLGRELSDRLFTLYPNPARNNITLRGQGVDFRNYEFEIVDMTGRVYNNLDLNIRKQANRADIALDRLNGGSYFMLITGERKVWQMMFQKR